MRSLRDGLRPLLVRHVRAYFEFAPMRRTRLKKRSRQKTANVTPRKRASSSRPMSSGEEFVDALHFAVLVYKRQLSNCDRRTGPTRRSMSARRSPARLGPFQRGPVLTPTSPYRELFKPSRRLHDAADDRQHRRFVASDAAPSLAADGVGRPRLRPSRKSRARGRARYWTGVQANVPASKSAITRRSTSPGSRPSAAGAEASEKHSWSQNHVRTGCANRLSPAARLNCCDPDVTLVP